MSPGESISLDLATGQLKGKKVNARRNGVGGRQD